MNLSALGRYLAIEPTRLGELQSLSLKDGIPLTQTRTVSVRDNVAIIPLYGVITSRYDLLTYWSCNNLTSSRTTRLKWIYEH